MSTFRDRLLDLFGSQPVSGLAALTGNAQRTCSRWSSGARDVPQDVLEAVAEAERMLDESPLEPEVRTAVARALHAGLPAHAIAGRLERIADSIR